MSTDPESSSNSKTSQTECTTTTVIVRSDDSRVIANGILIGTLISNGSKPSLTIPVNQSNNNISAINSENEIENCSNSCVSIVNCYRATPAKVEDICGEETVEPSNCAEQPDESSDSNLDAIKLDISDHQQQQRQQQQRTYISTEAQTDNHIPPRAPERKTSIPTQNDYIAREHRRRERRERRQSRRPNTTHSHYQHPPLSPATPHHPHPHPNLHPHEQRHSSISPSQAPPFEILPDLLNLPPPYTTLPAVPRPIVPSITSAVNVCGAPEDIRYAFSIPVIRRSPSELSGKGCCGQWLAGPPLRAAIALVALGGIACALGGVSLGITGLAGPPAPQLSGALFMIGIGVILVVISGAAWKLTSSASSTCLGISTADLSRCSRRPCNQSQHGLLYPEYQHRQPPPSYQASMQEYRLRLLLLDRGRNPNRDCIPSPPPTYRSQNGTLIRSSQISDNQFNTRSVISNPPQYYTIDRHHLSHPAIEHHQSNPRTTSSISNNNCVNTNQVNINVSNTITTEVHQQPMSTLSLAAAEEDSSVSECKIIHKSLDNSLESFKSGDSKTKSNTELVTIVTVSGCTDTEQLHNEMEILAHV